MDQHLLILDLDETLIYGTEAPLERPHDFRIGPYFVYRRPYLTDFLSTVDDWFELAVWSSASPGYVAGVVGGVFPDPGRLRFIWASDRCTQRFDADRRGYYWLKNLNKAKRAGYPLERILVVDDSAEKLELHYGNLLRVRPFTGQADDTELRDLLPFLDRLRSVENVRRVEKRFWREFGRTGYE
ncbi:MAG: NIF family HAD-type phosphatase [Armatimonadota bacterium]